MEGHETAADSHGRTLCNEKEAGFADTARAGTLCFSPFVLGVHMLQ